MIVTNGLVSHRQIPNQGGLILHPDLLLWEKDLRTRSRQWFECTQQISLAVYAAMLDVSPSQCIAMQLADYQSEKQYWVASAYHAQLTRDSVRVMPEGMFTWCEEDARCLCEILNPWLLEDGMRLQYVGAALVLECDTPLAMSPISFAEIAGGCLPNRHAEGADGGRMMRLMSEIQMILKQTPAPHRRARGESDIHGLWFWGQGEALKEMLAPFSVATRNPYLQSVVDGKDATVMISDAEGLSGLIKQTQSLPKRVVLLGEKHAVVLNKTWLPYWRKRSWLPKKVNQDISFKSMLGDR